MNASIFPIEMECVYTPDELGETDYRKARIVIAIGNNKAEISVTPEKPMTRSELGSILNYLTTTVLNKARISLNADCTVILRQSGLSYSVEWDENIAAVKGLTPLG
jgi:hypothetical protein